jgi:hypothetical protein
MYACMYVCVCVYVIVTHYELGGTGFEPRWGKDFPYQAIPHPRPIQSQVKWVPGLLPGGERPGHDVNHPPPSSSEVKERVELYRYPHSGPSYLVVGRTLQNYTVNL